jgi:hypothetical protein
MQPLQLKSLVDAGHYKPEPALVAAAMLRHRGVRALLTDADSVTAGQTRPAPASRPQAA